MTFCDFSIDNRSLGVDKGLFAPGGPGVSVNDLAQKLPEDVAVKIAYNPLIIEEMCFYYVELMLGEFGKLKINKKEGRQIRQIMTQRDRELGNMVSHDSIARFRGNVKEFMAENARDLAILYFSINGELKRLYPAFDAEYDSITYMLLVIAFAHYYRRECSRVDAILDATMGAHGTDSEASAIPFIHKIVSRLAAPYDIERKDTIALALKIVVNRIEAIDFNIIDR
ncbi:MAG: hypothetical protein U0L43_01735 [Muribaculaceae bacterium]|nr:hypothetical protein [Muribaculaceae bacterium]